MQGEAITVALRLPGLVVVETREDAHSIEVVAQYERATAECPRCERPTAAVHQWHEQWKRDLALWGKTVWVLVQKRRFRCRRCRRTFMEPDTACGPRRRTTERLRGHAADQAQEASVQAVARWNVVSQGLVERSWRERHGAVRPATAPHVLVGLDGFCVRRPGRMWSALWDLETRRPIAAVTSERGADVRAMLKRHADPKVVRAVVIDLSDGYRAAIEAELPHTAIVADKFHVIALANRALVRVRGGRRLRGTTAWLLHRGAERLTREQQDRVAAALAFDPSTALAWSLKERLRALYRLRSSRQAALALDRWIADATASELEPFQRTGRTLLRWRREVLNYWSYRVTNAVVEGKHNRVKMLKRRAYGYRNERGFLLRILNLFHAE